MTERKDLRQVCQSVFVGLNDSHLARLGADAVARCNALRELRPMTRLHCIEDLVDLLKVPALNGVEVVVVSFRKTRHGQFVVPTLSVHMPCGSPGIVLSSIDEVHQSISGLDSKPLSNASAKRWKLNSLYSRAKRAGFQKIVTGMSHGKHSARAAVFYRAAQPVTGEATLSYLEAVGQAACAIQEQSLNLTNDANDKALQDWRHLYDRICPGGLGPLHSVDEAVWSFRDFAHEQYGLRSLVFEYLPRTKTWKAMPRNASERAPVTYDRLVNSLLRRPDARKPLYGRRGRVYTCLIPFTSHRTETFLQYAILLTSRSPIAWYVPENITRFIDYYFNDAVQQERLRTVKELNERTLALHEQPHTFFGDDRFSYVDKLRDFCDDTFRRVLRVSNAFAATLRLSDPSHRGLRLIAEVSDPQMRKLAEGERVDLIPLRHVGQSLNARTFREKARGEYMVRERITDGMEGRYNVRFKSLSEICFTICFKGVRIGTVNFEYPMFVGYRSEIDYLRAITSAIENHAALLLEFSDKYWLTRRAQYEQNVHEAENLIRRSQLPERTKDELIGYLLEKLVVGEGTDSLSTLQHYVDRYIRSRLGFKTGERHARYARSCATTFTNPDAAVSAYWVRLVEIILKNLLDNFFKYCDDQRDHLVISHAGDARDPLIIEVNGSLPFPDVVLRDGSFRPIPTADPKKTDCKGLLIVGILARHLGGYVEVANLPRSHRCFLKVIVPFTGVVA